MAKKYNELQPGFIISNRYEVVKCLGIGSMGAVYECNHKELTGHKVAIKVLFPEVANDKISIARFRNEIFAAYEVSHPNVVRAYEYIKENGIVAYTMEYVNGGDLADYLKDTSKLLPINRIIDILIQMTAGVNALHEAGIIHRDLKPENILLTQDGQVKIADFGIARTENGPRLTEYGGVVGTIDYISPEYIVKSQVDERSDIYAMGILAYEMIVGITPFKGNSVYDTMVTRLKKSVEAPSSKREDCPKELDKIILKATQKKPEDRFQTVKEFNIALQNLKNGKTNDIELKQDEGNNKIDYIGNEQQKLNGFEDKKNIEDDIEEMKASYRLASILSNSKKTSNIGEKRNIAISSSNIFNNPELKNFRKKQKRIRVIKKLALLFIIFSIVFAVYYCFQRDLIDINKTTTALKEKTITTYHTYNQKFSDLINKNKIK